MLNLYTKSRKVKYFYTFAQLYLAGHLFITNIIFLSII
jgi:hypothetical protein